MFNNIKNAFKKGEDFSSEVKGKGVMGTEKGETGTKIYDGIIDEEYITEIADVAERCELFDKMRKSDATIQAITQAVILPIVSANWFVQPASEDEKDKEIAEFIESCLFGMKKTWGSTLKEALSFIYFGFDYMEKVFRVDEDGMVRWEKFAYRKPQAHYRWIRDGNGNLEGVQQQLERSYKEDGDTMPVIPFEKLLYFAIDNEGDNFEGVSLLRYCRQAWLYKQKSMKIMAVHIERFGSPVPKIKLKNLSAKDRALAKELAMNLRVNEKSYLVETEGMEIGLLTPDRDVVGQKIENFIEYQDRQMQKSFLAKFLGTGDTGVGSMALSQTDLSFFILSLKSYAKIIQDEIDKAIKELTILNFGEQEGYPTLQVTEIGEKDIEGFTGMIDKLLSAGVLDKENKKDIDFIREELNLPKITDEEFEEQRVKREEAQAAIQEGIAKKGDDDEVKKETENKEKVKNSFFLAEIKTVKLKERIFQESINKQEDFLQMYYKKQYVPLLEATEDKLRNYIELQYKKAKTEVVAGTRIITRSGNDALMKETIKGVKEIMKGFQDKLEGKMMNTVHKKSMENAISMIRDTEKRVELAEFMVSQGEMNSFIAGYKSNIRGVVFNEGRRVEERVFDNFTQENQLQLALDQVKELSINRNIYKLSTISHPRGLFRRTVEIKGDNEGVQKYKMLITAKRKKKLAPYGALALLAYSIKEKREWNEKYGTKSNINVVGGLGIHHGSDEYYMPIWMDESEEQEEISKVQRMELNDEIDQME